MRQRRNTFDDVRLLVQVMENYHDGRAQNSIFRSVVLLVYAFRLLRALPPEVRRPRAPKARSFTSCTTSGDGSLSLIRIFDNTRLDIGELLYDESPVGILPEGYRRMSRSAGRYRVPRVNAKRPRVDNTEVAGFD